MSLARIAVRALIAYAYLYALGRGGGKRVVSQASPFDFLVSLIVGDVFDNAVWGEVSMAQFAAAAGSVFFCDAVVKLVARHHPRFLHIANGTPRIVLRDGVEDGDALRAEQLNEGDLAHLLREQGIEEWSDVRLAIMERDGALSVSMVDGAQAAQRRDLA